MTIKQASVHGFLISNYYKWLFRDLPNDFCTLWWNTLASLPLLPFLIPAYLVSFIFGRYDVWLDRNLLGKAFRGVLTYFLTVVALFFGLASFEKVFGQAWRTWDFWPVLGAAVVGFIGIAVFVIVVIGGIVGICAGISWLFTTIRNSFRTKITRNVVDEDGHEYSRTYYEPKELKVVVLWNTLRQKYCKKITWE